MKNRYFVDLISKHKRSKHIKHHGNFYRLTSRTHLQNYHIGHGVWDLKWEFVL